MRLRRAGEKRLIVLLARKVNRMSGGPVNVKDSNGSTAAGIGMTLIVLVAVIIALVAWHPWSVTTTTKSSAATTGDGNSSGGN